MKKERSRIEKLLTVCAGAAAGALLTLVFFRDPWMAVLGTAGGALLFPLAYRREREEKRTARQEEELIRLLKGLCTVLRSGLSLENAMERAVKPEELKEYPLLGEAWRQAITELGNRRPPEKVLAEFAEKTGIEEMKKLAAVAEICRREGGSMALSAARAAELLQRKSSFRAEARVLLARKRLEQRILTLMPFLLLALLSFMSPGYFDIMYTSLEGRLLMGAGLLLMLFSTWLSRRLARTEV